MGVNGKRAGWPVRLAAMMLAGGLAVGVAWANPPVQEGAGAVTEPAARVSDGRMASAAAALAKGMRYLMGADGEKDVPAGVRWIEQAAALGYAPAEHEMGVLSLMGIGLARDPAAAVAWFEKAARQGYVPSETALGFAYAQGSGVGRDLSRASYWFHRAAARGSGIAQESLEGGL